MKLVKHGDLVLFLFFFSPDHFAGGDGWRAFARQEGVYPHDRQLPRVFKCFVIEALLLDPAPLVHGFHGAKHAPAFRYPFKFQHDGFFHEVGQLLDNEGPLQRILIFCQSQFVVDNHLDGHRPAD